MSTLADKVDKQFTYQHTVHATSGNPADLAVTVDHLTDLIAAQTRQDPDRVRPRVKAELDRRADTGELLRWVDIYGPSNRADRDDHYLLNARKDMSCL